MKNFDTMPSVETNESDWQKLKQDAPARATELMNELGIDGMTSLDEQIDALKGLLDNLQSDNKNRFVYQKIAVKLEMTMLERSYRNQKEHYEMLLAQ